MILEKKRSVNSRSLPQAPASAACVVITSTAVADPCITAALCCQALPDLLAHEAGEWDEGTKSLLHALYECEAAPEVQVPDDCPPIVLRPAATRAVPLLHTVLPEAPGGPPRRSRVQGLYWRPVPGPSGVSSSCLSSARQKLAALQHWRVRWRGAVHQLATAAPLPAGHPADVCRAAPGLVLDSMLPPSADSHAAFSGGVHRLGGTPSKGRGSVRCSPTTPSPKLPGQGQLPSAWRQLSGSAEPVHEVRSPPPQVALCLL